MATWIEELTRAGPPNEEVSLPPVNELASVLEELAIPRDDIDGIVTGLPTPAAAPEIWWLLERCANSLIRKMGGAEDWPAFPVLPESMGDAGRYFYVYVFLATLPHTQAFHRARHIPDDVSTRTMADLGRNMAIHRVQYGSGGLHVPYWLTRHFCGAIYHLGRLQFERARLGRRTGQAVQAAGLPLGPGDQTLSVHIPDLSGPLTPSACNAAFELAREFFSRHFPEERYHIAVCHSWLLDDQLAEYLPANANIIDFQRRFRTAYRSDEKNDDDIIGFVFGRTAISLEELPQRTTLERAVVTHLRAGRHWRVGHGWLLL